jgi:hypothetical protein
MIQENECLTLVRQLYAKFTGLEVAAAIKILRAELTAEADRTELQNKILADQIKLQGLTKK